MRWCKHRVRGSRAALAFNDETILTQLRLAALIASLASRLVGALWLLAARSRSSADFFPAFLPISPIALSD
jgi:hypothetical protein